LFAEEDREHAEVEMEDDAETYGGRVDGRKGRL